MSDLMPAPKGYPIKIVRDRTAAIVNSSEQPGDLFYASIPQGQRAAWLCRKLIEEAAEYLASGDLAELADVLAVVEGLAWAGHGKTLSELRAAMMSDPRGGFLEGVMMYGYHPEFDGRET